MLLRSAVGLIIPQPRLPALMRRTRVCARAKHHTPRIGAHQSHMRRTPPGARPNHTLKTRSGVHLSSSRAQVRIRSVPTATLVIHHACTLALALYSRAHYALELTPSRSASAVLALTPVPGLVLRRAARVLVDCVYCGGVAFAAAQAARIHAPQRICLARAGGVKI